MFIRLFLTNVMVIFASAQLSIQASTEYDKFYSAGVVEFRPSGSLDLEAGMQNNLKGYLTILESEEAKHLDIIVFPESTLNNDDQATFVPDPSTGLTVPCDEEHSEYHSLLVQLSCAAKQLAAYVVINLTEKELCNTVPEDTRPCTSSGLNLYNTNVVFDRNGTVVSRYRKIHLYGENKNTTFVPEIVWFDTDFGVRFGHFICFDILFYTPAQSMVVDNGIKDFIFTSMWFSQLPFLTAVQVQQAWSYANNVNLLAAGASNPLVGSTGTGVYHGREGVLVAKMNQISGERRLYVTQVPKYARLTKRSVAKSSFNQAIRAEPHLVLKRDHLQGYESIYLNLTANTSLKQEICFSNSSFCCTFELKWQPLNFQTKSKHYHYRLGVYDGWRNEMAAETNQLKNCALFSCAGEDIMQCGKLLDTDTDVVFENIIMTATFPKAERFLIMPNSLNSNIMPLSVNHFQWQETDQKNTVQVRYELNTSTPNMMAFSIYGNYYDCIVDAIAEQDGDKGNGVATPNTFSFKLIGGIFILNSINKILLAL